MSHNWQIFGFSTSRPGPIDYRVLVPGFILTGLVAYLLGSIPTGFLVAKARGVDIRTVGSGNIGATNVFRYLGKPAGIFVLLVDALKGWLAVVVVTRVIISACHVPGDRMTQEWLAICAGVSAILGHNFTCWLHFKGGKGIATSAGVLTALVPWSLVIILTVWIIVFALTRYVSLASICASFALPFAAWLTHESVTMVAITTALAILAVYKHKTNIKRLINGTESRLILRKSATEAPKQT
jgi:acyl phosphate:glycerol-3-phosphate acyltransferase